MEYTVIWEIDIEANSPKEAAEQALKIQRDSSSDAVYFTIREQLSGNEVAIDLLDRIDKEI